MAYQFDDGLPFEYGRADDLKCAASHTLKTANRERWRKDRDPSHFLRTGSRPANPWGDPGQRFVGFAVACTSNDLIGAQGNHARLRELLCISTISGGGPRAAGILDDERAEAGSHGVETGMADASVE
jgi:hypothetical protein